MVATAIVPTTVWVRPASDLASCEAALLFVWTFGLLASTVVLAPPAAAHPAPASRALALLERWLSLLQPPRKLRLRGIAAWMLRWVLVLVCMWVACVAAGGALP